MDQKLKEFFDKNEAFERDIILKERESVLIGCGLYSSEKQFSNKREGGYSIYDPVAKSYYKEVKTPLDVTDEEYSRILEICRRKQAAAAKTETEWRAKNIHLEQVNPHAERILNFVISCRLILTIILSVMFLVVGIVLNGQIDIAEPWPLVLGILLALIVLAFGLVFWALQKVVINMSNNLHNISTLSQSEMKK